VSEVDNRTNLLGMTRPRLEAWFAELGEKPFRAKQVMKWIHHQGVVDFADMTDLSKPLREKLARVAQVSPPKVVYDNTAADGTRKWLIQVASGSAVETVFIPDGRRGTLCVSSQAGCSLDCSFCSTGKQGFNSNLTVHEIVGQIWIAAQALGNVPATRERKITNVVMMGMGEPLLNFDNVVDTVNLAMDDFGYGLSKRRVTISTSGVVPALRKLAAHTDASLAVSLHAPTDDLRDILVPINQRYPIAELLEASRFYMSHLADTHRVMTIEYTLIEGVNDEVEHARALGLLLADTPCKINLIPFNPFPGSDYRKPGAARVIRFRDALWKAGHVVTIRSTRGDDISAACGQLVGEVQDRTRRSARYIPLEDITERSKEVQNLKGVA
jgi:23S rRNA (adenine2503-C2)-methyltransferase